MNNIPLSRITRTLSSKHRSVDILPFVAIDVASADFDGDGVSDLVFVDNQGLDVLEGSSRGIRIAYGKRSEGFEQANESLYALPRPDNTHELQLAVADLNADSKPDILARSGQSIFGFANNGDRTFEMPWRVDARTEFSAFAVAEGGAFPTLVLLPAGLDEIHLLQVEPAGIESAPKVVPLSGAKAFSVHAVDLNNDGVQDVVVSSDRGYHAFLRSAGGELTAMPLVPAEGASRIVALSLGSSVAIVGFRRDVIDLLKLEGGRIGLSSSYFVGEVSTLELLSGDTADTFSIAIARPDGSLALVPGTIEPLALATTFPLVLDVYDEASRARGIDIDGDGQFEIAISFPKRGSVAIAPLRDITKSKDFTVSGYVTALVTLPSSYGSPLLAVGTLSDRDSGLVLLENDQAGMVDVIQDVDAPAPFDIAPLSRKNQKEPALLISSSRQRRLALVSRSDAQFTLLSNVSTNFTPGYLTTADIDCDGNEEFLTPDYYSGRIHILRMNGAEIEEVGSFDVEPTVLMIRTWSAPMGTIALVLTHRSLKLRSYLVSPDGSASLLDEVDYSNLIEGHSANQLLKVDSSCGQSGDWVLLGERGFFLQGRLGREGNISLQEHAMGVSLKNVIDADLSDLDSDGIPDLLMTDYEPYSNTRLGILKGRCEPR